jgi:hypothetical protein
VFHVGVKEWGARQMVKEFLTNFSQTRERKRLLLSYFAHVEYIKLRMKCQLRVKKVRFEWLNNYWDTEVEEYKNYL